MTPGPRPIRTTGFDGNSSDYRTNNVVALLSGCATTQHARDVQPSRFLGEYGSLLEPGKGDEEALLRYRNPKADWTAYYTERHK